MNVEVRGLDHLRKVTTPALFQEAIQEIVTKGAIYGENQAKLRAPVDTGRLRGAISHEVGALQSRYGVVGGGTVGGYGKKLDESVIARYRYRRGPRQGDLLKGWFSDTLKMTQSHVAELVDRAIQRIESTWANG